MSARPNSADRHPLEAPHSRRGFLKTAGAGALSLAAAGLLIPHASALSSRAGAAANDDVASLDVEVLNFALNLEYLEAEFYAHATTGKGLDAVGIPVNGTDGTKAGPVIVKVSQSTKVPFKNPAIQQYANEIAKDEENHVKFIQDALTSLGATYVARPKIDLLNSFRALGNLIGVHNFDPFANDISFLLGAYIFEDVGVTAYHGAAPLLTNKTVLNYAAGILAVEAYHAGLVRANLFAANQGPATQAISAVRVMFGGQSIDSNGQPADPDYGVMSPVEGPNTSSIVLADSNSIAFNRTPQQVLNIVYASQTGKPGGFFPNGINGAIK